MTSWRPGEGIQTGLPGKPRKAITYVILYIIFSVSCPVYCMELNLCYKLLTVYLKSKFHWTSYILLC